MKLTTEDDKAPLDSCPVPRDLGEIGEYGALSVIRKNLSRVEDPSVVRGIGDDCAVISTGEDTYLLVTTDTLAEGVHFRLDYTTPYLLGKKALAVNLSDLAAMGGHPMYAFLNLAAPASIPVHFVHQFLRGVNFWCKRYDVSVLGGDTVACPSGVVVTMTVLGHGKKGEIAFRSGACEGDLVFVSGNLGGAAAGLAVLQRGRQPNAPYRGLLKAHLDPTPQVELGRLLAHNRLVSSMIDLSDGLATDLAHVAEESGVGAEVYADKIPICASCRRLAKELGCSPLPWAISGGEDYGLLFTVPPDRVERLKDEVPHGSFCVGRIVKPKGVFLVEDGRKKDIAYQGYNHFAKRTRSRPPDTRDSTG